MTDIDSTLQERGSRYGTFKGHAEISQAIKQIMYCSPNWMADKLTDSQCECLEMVAHKLGRILNGDPHYDDSWIDIAGYTQLVVKQLHGEDI